MINSNRRADRHGTSNSRFSRLHAKVPKNSPNNLKNQGHRSHTEERYKPSIIRPLLKNLPTTVKSKERKLTWVYLDTQSLHIPLNLSKFVA
jgi:hypothetical protein